MTLRETVYKHGSDTSARMEFLENTITHAGYRIVKKEEKGKLFELTIKDRDGKNGYVMGYREYPSAITVGGFVVGEVLEPK